MAKQNPNGTWVLSGTNTYTAGTTVNEGTFYVYGDQRAATGGWIVSPFSHTNVTCNFQSGSSIVVASNKTIQIGYTIASGNALPVMNVAGTVTNTGALLVGRRATLNLNNGAVWTQGGDMSITGYGGAIEYMNVNSGATFNYGGTNSIKIEPAASNTGGSVLTIKGVFNTKQGFERTTATTTGSGKISISSGGQLKLTGPVSDLTINATNKPLVFALESGGGTIDVDTNNTLISTVVSGNGALTKSGTGMLMLSATNTYTGTTTNKNGTLKLTGGNNRLLNTGTFSFASTSTLDVDNTSQTLTTMLFPDSATTATIKGAGGALIINGTANFDCGPGGTVSNTPLITLNMMDLSNFTYDSTNSTFRAGIKSNGNTGNIGQIATVTLASTNTIRASVLAVGDRPANSDGGGSTLHLGQNNTLLIATNNIGDSGRSDVVLDFMAGLSNPTVTVRNTDGSSAVLLWNVGRVAQYSGAAQTTFTATADFSAGTLDALVTSMTIGNAEAGNATVRVGTQNSFFYMGAGSLTVATFTLGKIANTGGDGITTGTLGGTFRGNGTFTLNGGTVNATTITMAVNTITDVSNVIKTVTGTFNLSNGTLRVATLQKGAQTGTAAATNTFRWVAGTIGNISGSDLIWTNSPLTLQTAASHLFDITGANTATFDVNSIISGSGCAITKMGTGRLMLCGANTYSGGTIVSNGTLAAGCNHALYTGSDLIVSGGIFDAGSYANTLGILTLSSGTSSTLLVNNGTCTLSFTGMSGTGTLAVTGTLGLTSIRFGINDGTLTPEQLSRITINGKKATLNSNGYLRELTGTMILVR